MRTGCTSYIDLIFVVDVSGSIQSERIKMVREFLVSIVADLDIGLNSTRVGAAYFSDEAYVAFTLDQYWTIQDVQEAIRYIPYVGGKTNIAAGLTITRTDLLQVTYLHSLHAVSTHVSSRSAVATLQTAIHLLLTYLLSLLTLTAIYTTAPGHLKFGT